MRLSRWVIGVGGVLAVSLALPVGWSSARTQGPARTTAGIKVGLITKTDTNPFFVKMKDGAQKQAKALGATLLTAAGKIDGDAATQITAIENMVSAGVKGILITPSNDSVVPAIKKARAKGVLVIALDTPPNPPSAVDALFATNNFTAGVLIGKYAKALFKGKTAKIAMLDLFPGPSVGYLRHNGFLNGWGPRASAPRTPRSTTRRRRSCATPTPRATRPRARPQWRPVSRRTRTSTSSTRSTSPPPPAPTRR